MKSCTVALVFVALISRYAGASTQISDHALVIGNYQLKLSEEDKGLAILLDAPLPTGSLKLKDDHKFVLDTKNGDRLVHRTGIYERQGDELTFELDDVGTKLTGHLKDDGLELNGLTYVHQDDASVTGKWHVKGVDARVEFKEDGTFKFTSTGAVSMGKFTLDGVTLELKWTSIDGEDQEEGRVHKKITLDPDGTFWIDNYHYIKN